MLLKLKQETLEDRGLNGKDYVARGGAFPIRVEGVGVIGSVIVSGLDHMADHDFAVACISQYLRIDNIRVCGELLVGIFLIFAYI